MSVFFLLFSFAQICKNQALTSEERLYASKSQSKDPPQKPTTPHQNPKSPLTKAAAVGALDREMILLTKPVLLILDELGYVPIDLDQARILLQVIADAYETTSLIVTANLEFARQGEFWLFGGFV